MSGEAAADETRIRESPTATHPGGRPPDVPERIGAYRILEVLGEGGMGVVYHAEQTEPVSRRVALKIIKLGMETKEVVARFETERQALALMDHPSIARVYDAGATETGRPYFVMELVRGVPLTDYCDQAKLTTRERLRLFIEVCQAVQHAHQKGVIHRDLKPSNILVSLQDGKPVVKIIDFGIAKAMYRRLTDQTLVTHIGDVIGTPAFMSPEQLEGTLLDVDTRADIYSLGVTLYLLLTGDLPFDLEQMRKAGGFAAVYVREHEPPRPSARVTTAKSPQAVAESRQTDVAHLRRALQGDLDWIVLKAMAKDRQRRYETANGLALDLERHLRDEPVTARPPSAAYRAGKFTRRHRAAVAFVAALAVTLVVFAVATALQSRRVVRERDRAEAEAKKAAAVSQFLQETLGAADPWQSGRDQSVREALRAAAEKVEASFKDQPLVAAAVRRTIGLTYIGLGRYGEAEPLLRSALEVRTRERGPDHPEVAESLGDLSLVEERLSRFDESVALARQALAIRQKAGGEGAASAARASRRLGVALFFKGEYAESERLLRDALEIQSKSPTADAIERAGALSDLAQTLGSGRQDAPAAEKLLREALDIRRAKQGPDHPQTALALNDLAVSRFQQQDYQEAEALFREALAADEKSLGREHPETAAALENLGGVLLRTARYDEALALLDRVLAARKKGLGEDDLQVVRTLHNIAVVQTNAGRVAEAEATFAAVLPRMKALQGPDHPEVAQALASWAKLKMDEKDYEAAERLFRQSLGLRLAKLGEDHLAVATGRVKLASVLVLRGRFAEAEPLLEKAHEVRERVLGKEAAPTQEAAAELQKLYAAWGRPQP
jgi:serine/threonine protein kinase/tetratricopeptide (TPR) repeat protein